MFKGPVQSGLLPFFEATRPQPVAEISDFARTATATDGNQLHSVATGFLKTGCPHINYNN